MGEGSVEPRSSAYLSLRVPDDALLGAIAHETALSDAKLAGFVEAMTAEGADPAEAVALALTVGRAGHPGSAAALLALEARLAARELLAEAKAVRLARALLELRPPPSVSRGEEGYRFEEADGELWIADPVAAHWHRQGRWGPPLRPDPDRPQVVARGEGQVVTLFGRAMAGDTILVSFEPPRLAREVAPALRLTRAGLSRHPALRELVRWSELRSVGRVEGRGVAAYEPASGAPVALPPRPSIPVEELVDLMGRLLERSRA